MEKNRSKAEKLVREAVRRGAKLVVLPEHYSAGHFYKDRMKFCQVTDGPLMNGLKELATKHSTYIVAPFLEKAEPHCLCSAALISPEGTISKYSKQVLVGAEKVLYAAGSRSGVFPTEFGKIGIFLGYDMSKASLVSGYEGIDLAVVASALPRIDLMPWLDDQKIESGRILPLAVAMQLGCPLVFSNLYGPLKMVVPSLIDFRDFSEVIVFDTRFSGKSFIADYTGHVLVEAADEGNRALVTEVDLEMARSFREMMLSEEAVAIMRRNIFGPC